MLERPVPCLLLSVLAVLSVLPAPLLVAEERDRDQPYQGMDVIGAVKAVRDAIAPEVPASVRGKPWENDIAALTSPDPHRANAAVAALIRRGPAVLPDLAVLAEDRDWHVRQRVVRVAAFIGTDAGAAIVLARSHDEIVGVCEEAAMGLGQVKGPAAFPRLAELISEPEPNVRCAAARGLGLLGDARGFDVLLAVVRENDDMARREMREALTRIAFHPDTIPALAERLTRLRGAEAEVLVEVSALVGDTRLCPALVALVTAGDAELAQRAARALAADGDSRALGALAHVADGPPSTPLPEVAAATLRRLTLYEAAPGPAWRLWWRDHQKDVERLMPRDEFIAALHGDQGPPTAGELARFAVEDLRPLLDGALGSGPPWWPARAYRALAQDDARRWTPVLAAAIKAAPLASQRLPLILILDQLGDTAAATVFTGLLEQPEGPHRPQGSERLAIEVALERRQSVRP